MILSRESDQGLKNDKSSMMSRPRMVDWYRADQDGLDMRLAALSFAAQSIVATLGSLSLVANALIACHYCKRKNNKPGMEGYSTNNVG